MAMQNTLARLASASLQEMPAPDELAEEEIAGRLVMGDAELCAAKLAVEVAAMQPMHISYFMTRPVVPQSLTLLSMERFGAEVAPRLERHSGDPAGIDHP
jgi:hypothetical protein